MCIRDSECTVSFLEYPLAGYARRNNIDVAVNAQPAVSLSTTFASDFDRSPPVNNDVRIRPGGCIQHAGRIDLKAHS